jgi:hypothetical protein
MDCEVLTEVIMNRLGVTPCSPVEICICFTGVHRIHLQDRKPIQAKKRPNNNQSEELDFSETSVNYSPTWHHIP